MRSGDADRHLAEAVAALEAGQEYACGCYISGVGSRSGEPDGYRVRDGRVQRAVPANRYGGRPSGTRWVDVDGA